MFGKKLMKNIDRIRKNTKNKRQLFPDERRYQKPRSYGPDADYGLAEPLIQFLSAEELETKKLMFTSLNDVNFEQVEIDTRDQSDNEKWFYERKIRLTASRFGQICKMRANTSCKNTLYNILYALSAQSKSLKYGREVEDITRKSGINYKKKIEICGLIIDPNDPYLAASPGKSCFLLPCILIKNYISLNVFKYFNRIFFFYRWFN